ncbi:unnamed protein product [Phytophthora fragariaefolia]|uniref:Unnamed protein product n=1 Tax=Phytophthora fragariaefolia TaxID=1490495 RepID=A0A9W7CYK3_9STRA|nr:unnamed protein product [Phytophthora fragariaefolia]
MTPRVSTSISSATFSLQLDGRNCRRREHLSRVAVHWPEPSRPPDFAGVRVDDSPKEKAPRWTPELDGYPTDSIDETSDVDYHRSWSICHFVGRNAEQAVDSRQSMKSIRTLVDALPALKLNDAEEMELQNLAENFVLGNIDEYLEVSEQVRKTGRTPREWRELRHKDGIRVYTQRSKKSRVKDAPEPTVPSLLLLGTVQGTLNDVMYAVAASNDEDIKVKSKFVQDGIVDAKVLCEMVRPTVEDAYQHVNVAWRLYAVPEHRDYICVEASGIAVTAEGESIGYHVAHSVGFPQLPPFQKADVERGNLSVCALYRQRAPNSVECYVHGFFDFQEDDTVLSAISMNSMANQWLSFSQLIECAEMKKLVWRLRKKSARISIDTCSSSGSSFDLLAAQRRKSSGAAKASNHCAICTKGFGLLGSGKKACRVCGELVCSKCQVRKTVCTVRPWENAAILEKKLPVCGPCIEDVLKGNALDVARDEVHLRVYTRDSDWWSMSE